MQFLGHIVGINEIKPDLQKVEKLEKLPSPKNITQLRAFIGLASIIEDLSKDLLKRLRLYMSY